MLSRCANVQCSKPFLRLGQGKLFVLETEHTLSSEGLVQEQVRGRPRRLEHYWLCEQCAKIWTLVHDRENGIGLTELKRGPSSTPISAPTVADAA